MGFFGKIKANLSHGGVKVHVQAPASIPGNSVIPVVVTLSADSAQTINSVKAQIKERMHVQPGSMNRNSNFTTTSSGVNADEYTEQVVAEAQSNERLTIAPGETKTVELQLMLTGSAAMGRPLAALGASLGGSLGGALQTIPAVAGRLDNTNYTFSVHASADVDGIAMDPSDHQSIQILPPTEQPQPPVQTVQPTPPVPPQPPSGSPGLV